MSNTVTYLKKVHFIKQNVLKKSPVPSSGDPRVKLPVILLKTSKNDAKKEEYKCWITEFE